MPFDRLERVLQAEVNKVGESGARKGDEDVICEVHPPAGGKGPRFTLSQRGDQSFLRMNSNSYLGLSLRSEVMHAEERATRAYGAGPGDDRCVSRWVGRAAWH